MITTEKNIAGIPTSLLDGIDIDSFVEIFTGEKDKIIKHKEGNSKKGYLNSITKEPYIGCGLEGTNLVEEILPTIYYNSKISPPKPILLTGPSGSGKTSIAECFVQNFANADIRTIVKGKDDDIVKEKRSPILRIQNYANIMHEDVVGEWDAIRMIHAERGENIFDKDKFFRLGPLTKGIYSPKDPDFQGKGVLLDELSRADENTLNVYLEPLRERKITAGGECFGECQFGIFRPRFHVLATQNEGDVGTIDLPSAMQTRFSRVPVDFISPDSEKKLLDKALRKLTNKENLIAAAISVAPCLSSYFRGQGPGSRKLSVQPSIKDTIDMGKVLVSRASNVTNLKDNIELKEDLKRIFTSILGKTESDAQVVKDVLDKGETCKIA